MTNTTSNTTPSQSLKIALFAAMPEELEFLQEKLSAYHYETTEIYNFEFNIYEYDNKKILVACTGIGIAFAAMVTTLVHSHFKPDYMLLTGTAGAIRSGLKIRDVIIIERAFEAEIQPLFTDLEGTPFETSLTHPLNHEFIPSIYQASEELLAITHQVDFSDRSVHTGTAVTSNAFPAPIELFEQIKNADPYSIDMETSAFYQTTWLLRTPALAVRGISNILNQDGTDDKIHESDVKGSAQAAAVVILKIINKLSEEAEIES